MSQVNIYPSEQEILQIENEWNHDMNQKGWRFESPMYWNLSSSAKILEEMNRHENSHRHQDPPQWLFHSKLATFCRMFFLIVGFLLFIYGIAMFVVGTTPGSSDTFIPGIIFATSGAVLCLITVILSARSTSNSHEGYYDDEECNILLHKSMTDDENSSDSDWTVDVSDNELINVNSLYSGHGSRVSLAESDDYISAFSWSRL